MYGCDKQFQTVLYTWADLEKIQQKRTDVESRGFKGV